MNVLFVKVDHITIEGPNKCQIQGRIRGSSTLHGSIFSNGDISVNWGQYNSCGIYIFLNKGVKHNSKNQETPYYPVYYKIKISIIEIPGQRSKKSTNQILGTVSSSKRFSQKAFEMEASIHELSYKLSTESHVLWHIRN